MHFSGRDVNDLTDLKHYNQQLVLCRLYMDQILEAFSQEFSYIKLDHRIENATNTGENAEISNGK